MPNPIIFLIGLHGVGKSTIGRILSSQGFKHISLGDLSRLVHKRKIPTGFHLHFLALVGKHQQGQRMSPALIDALMDEIDSARHVRGIVIDGFPAEPYHVLSLPKNSTVVHLTCPEPERLIRLNGRSESTARKWDSSIESRRDEQVKAVFSVAQESRALRTQTIANEGDPEIIAGQVLATNLQF